MMATLFLAFLALLLLCSVYFGFIRNSQVHDQRVALVREVAEQATINDSCGRPSEHLWQFFEDVSYDDMLYKFWIPVDQFWYRYQKERQTIK